MSSWVEATIGYQKDNFEQTCDCCGAVFRVVVPGQKGHATKGVSMELNSGHKVMHALVNS